MNKYEYIFKRAVKKSMYFFAARSFLHLLHFFAKYIFFHCVYYFFRHTGKSVIRRMTAVYRTVAVWKQFKSVNKVHVIVTAVFLSPLPEPEKPKFRTGQPIFLEIIA